MQARLFNPHSPIYLVMNRNALTTEQDKHVFEYAHVNCVHCENLKQSIWHAEFIKKSPLNRKVRDGFWFKASERFFYLEELMRDYNLFNVVHLESDNLLYVDLSDIKEVLSEYVIAATFSHDDRCIPGFIYFSAPQIITELVKCMVENASKGLDDMYSIGLFRKKYGELFIKTLPIIMPDFIKKNILKDHSGKKSLTPHIFSYNFEKFNSLFDAAAYGQYIGGEDPRNGSPSGPYIDPFGVINSSLLQYEWAEDNEGRRIPYALYEGKKYRINNLHLHCKKLENFTSMRFEL